MPILQAVVQSERFLSEEAMVAIATELDLSTADVFGTASFYTFLDTVPAGKNSSRGKTITCHMKGKDASSPPWRTCSKSSLERPPCMGSLACCRPTAGMVPQRPVMLVNDEIYPEVTPEKAVEIIREYLKKTK
jgi:NADH:ubiquinone oxidoreductase subunit E